MLKIAPLIAMIVTLALAPALAAPPGCLQEIDNLTVECKFDITVSAHALGSSNFA